MTRKKLEELNLLDDFLFETMVSHPRFGETFSRRILEIILGRNIGRLKVVPQKVYPGSNTTLHGARLDVYLEDTGNPDCQDGSASIIPRLTQKDSMRAKTITD